MRAAALAARMGFGLALLTGGGVRAGEWPMYGHDLWHSSTNWQSAIKSSNVWALQKIWTFWTADAVSASPAVVDGVVYVGSWDGNFYALNANRACRESLQCLERQPSLEFLTCPRSSTRPLSRLGGCCLLPPGIRPTAMAGPCTPSRCLGGCNSKRRGYALL